MKPDLPFRMMLMRLVFPLSLREHLSQVPALCKKLDTGAGRHIELVVEVIPPGDIPLLKRGGAAAVFRPEQNLLMRQCDFFIFTRRRNIR